MNEPKAIFPLFTQKLFRIPDYQRGYAWQKDQLSAFWEDLLNLSEGRNHYTGVLTLKEIPKEMISPEDPEYWLVKDLNYSMFHIVDGQQRLTTIVILLYAIVSFVKLLPKNVRLSNQEVFLTPNLTLQNVIDQFLYRIKPSGNKYRTYTFGYTEDNPSYKYLRYNIFEEEGSGYIQETFYTLNLANAKKYFHEQIQNLYEEEGDSGIRGIYETLVNRFHLNEYIIRDEFDVFIAFETMNNRGKKLSDLELLKNRLIYLSTLYGERALDSADQKNLRHSINETWKEVYYQLGRKKSNPLNDDDFLRAHWIMYYKYSRKRGNDYIRFLLDEQFTPKRIYERIEQIVELEQAEELIDVELLDEDETDEQLEETSERKGLSPTKINKYAKSLKSSAKHWYQTYFPEDDDTLSEDEIAWIQRLNRLGMLYFRPLIMSILKNIKEPELRVRAFRAIERFIFIVFRLTSVRSNYQNSVYYNAARQLDRGEIDLDQLLVMLDESAKFLFNKDGSFWDDDFKTLMAKKFKGGKGYYGWSGIRYFLYEYELSLLEDSRQKKVDWTSLLKHEKDRISIEHIYPQTDSDDWQESFGSLSENEKVHFEGSLGNLLLLSASINSSLQNDSFSLKKKPKYDHSGNKIRNGYSDGSHSELEVAKRRKWTPNHIRQRGISLFKFMEFRWDFKFSSNRVRSQLLFLQPEEYDA
jgi:uncharacterized protein with ParB-like and HNH nuclease domain